MKQKTIITDKVVMLVVDLPDGATGIDVIKYWGVRNKICFRTPYVKGWERADNIDISDGNWQYTGKATELAEEDWKGIVDEAFTTGLGQYTKPSDLDGWKVVNSPMGVRYEKVTHVSFKDYTIPTEGFSIAAQHPFQTATESGLSLLKANGVDLSEWRNCHVFIKQN